MGTIAQLMMAAPDALLATDFNVKPERIDSALPDIKLLLGWMKWGGLLAGVVGLIICGFMMIIGRRGRSQTAVEGAAGIPWIFAGLTLISLAASLVASIGVFNP